MPVKPGSVCPAFHPLAVIEVVFPLANVALLAVHRFKVAEAIGLIVLPGSLVCVTIWTPKLALAIGLVVVPLAFVLRLVGPALHPVATLFAFLVDVARVESVLHDLYILNVLELVLLNHLPQLGYLLSRPAVKTLEVFLARSYQLLLLLQARLKVFLLFRAGIALVLRVVVRVLLVDFTKVAVLSLLNLSLPEHLARLLDHLWLLWWRV